MGCRKLTYYESKTAIGENWKIFASGVEKTASSSIFCKDYYAGGFPLPGRHTVQTSSDYDANGNRVYRYGIQGSEKDFEITNVTGAHITTYFREFDTRLNRTWSVDPKPTAWESPYASMANNPILYNDVLGDTIRITYTVGKDRQLKTMTYIPGMKYNGDNKFLSQTIGDLNKLNSKSKGKEMIGDLHSISDDVTVMESVKGSKASGFNVGFDISSKISGIDTDGNVKSPSFVTLGHELAHVWDHSLGTLDESTWYKSEDGKIVRNAEKFATHIENQIRAEHSISLRTHYGLIKDASGNYRGNPQSRILNNKGESLFFKTTTKIKLIAPDAGLWNDGQNNTIIEGTHVAPFKY